MNKTIYYLVEIQNLTDGEVKKLLLKDSEIPDFMDNLDKDNFGLLNMYGLGFLNLDYKEFIKKQSS
jgi:hypothetical protein